MNTQLRICETRTGKGTTCVHARSLSQVQLFETPWAIQPATLSVHGDSPGKNAGVGCHFLLQGIVATQDSNQFPVSPSLADGFFTAEHHGKPKGGIPEGKKE